MEKSAATAAAAVEIESTPSPPESKRPRRCVQSKLPWHVPRVEENRGKVEEKEEAEEGTESEWSEGERKRKRKKGKSRARIPRKSPVANKEGQGLSTRNEILERSSQQRQKKQEDAVVLKVGNSKRCKALESGTSNKNCRQLKNKETGDPTTTKAPTSRYSNNNGSNYKQRLANEKSEATKGLDGKNSNIHKPSSDLWLEAKLTAEENMRLSAGKQTHPFFTSRKAAKRLPENQEIIKMKSRRWPGLDGDYFVACPPVHVFETLRDNVALLDWSNWVLSESTIFDSNGHHARENTSSVFECSVKPLKLDTICHKQRNLEQSSDKLEDGSIISAAGSCIFSDGLDTIGQVASNWKMVHFSSGISLLSTCDSCLGNLEEEEQGRLLKERLASYQQRSSCWPECNLWTNKYQPENALEVCGNSESIRFLGEWLKSWHERGLQSSSKNKKVVEQCAIEDSEDSLYEDESGTDDEATLKNVLLITGPVGSGKSASIYACAKEQGFDVIEVNASDLRNGAHIKQKFGDAVESHGFNYRSLEDPVGSRRKQILELLSSSAGVRTDEDDSHGMASEMCKKDATPMECSWDSMENRCTPCHVPYKSLILFEDVDIVFDEDRGFISTILQLAQTTKRPIILTSNNKNPVLPQILGQFVLNFALPSSKDLFAHLCMICASEKADISSDLLEHIIRSCLGDIRKTLMLLQFWCQGKRVQIDGNSRCCYSPLPFDIDAAHLVIERLIPWEFPCGISEKVGEEIDKTISMLEENLWRKQQELNSTAVIDPSEQGANVSTPIKARKRSLSKRNHSFPDPTEFSDHGNDLDDYSNTYASPESHVQPKVKRKRCLVLSSQSDSSSADDLPFTTNLSSHSNDYQLRGISAATNLQAQEACNHFELPNDPIYQLRRDDTDQLPSESFNIAPASDICDVFNLQDVSCVPESSFIPGNEINEDGLVSLAVSSNSTSVSFADFLKPVDVLTLGDANNSDRTIVEFSKCLENDAGHACERDVESVHGNEDLGNSQCEDKELPSSHCLLIDECSRADFSLQSMPEKNCACLLEVDPVQETWRKLRCHREDLMSCLTTNRKDASLIAKFTSGLTDLISNTDIMLSSCHPLVSDMLDPSMTPCVEPDNCSWYEEQYEMGSTYAQHGFCLYTNNCSAVGSNLGCANTVDLSQEMLTSSTDTMALGKLLSQGKTTNQNSCLDRDLEVQLPRRGVSTGRELKSTLYNAILPMVPARLSMAVRGLAFHEYSSFMSQISKLECSRISESREGSQQKQRRSRASRHYLSSGSLSLSPEQVELLTQSCCFKG